MDITIYDRRHNNFRNPPDYNGIKFYRGDICPLSEILYRKVINELWTFRQYCFMNLHYYTARERMKPKIAYNSARLCRKRRASLGDLE